ncbi:uncharacterized protein LOC111342617 [Stylophora pistillata]|uniref:uncharacterized protein LOC111342617 n=1 Tax=Stylophora pistillata TaxID=50429 RepID=UPI000C04E9EB|nr:uncharacterized protein LOC111342617 [Stylophora pistillata]
MSYSPTKSIDEIDDLLEMVKIMQVLDIPSKGLLTLDELKRQVITALNQSQTKPNWIAGQALSILSEARDRDLRKKDILSGLYAECEKCLTKMDTKIRALLNCKIGNIDELIRKHQTDLKRNDYVLLVAGETGSGKSSLINLVLGEELLPYSVLSTTSTICELRYGEKRKIVAHFKDKDSKTGHETFEHFLEQPTEASGESYLQQLSPFVQVKDGDREKGSVYKKIELYWPHQLLQNGIVIVDSPGIGESEIMDEEVVKYLPEAFAFVYVINSENAGGVQKDRLEKLLEEVRKVTLNERGEFSSKCALFVCNKWDQIPQREIEEVKYYVVRKLEKCWPGLVAEAQIIYMSTKKATAAQKLGIITGDFFYLMNGIRSTVVKSMEVRQENYWKWLDYLLSRIVYQAKAFVMNANRKRSNVVKKMERIYQRLSTIEREQDEVMEDLRKHLKAKISEALQKLSKFLTSDEVRTRFTSWNLDEVPEVEVSWQVTENKIDKALQGRLREIIEHWEEEKQVFTDARDSLLQYFQEQYDFVEGQIQNLQESVTTDDPISVAKADPSAERFSTAAIIAIGVTSPIWVPLTLFALVIGSPVVGIISIKNKVEDSKRLRRYENDKCSFMAERSAEYLNHGTNDSVLKVFVKSQLRGAKLCLKQIEARIPELIHADKMLCNQLRHETRSCDEIQRSYQPLLDHASDIRGQLALFGIKEIRGADISSEDLEWNADMSFLGQGEFATVIEGKMKRHGEEQNIALKIWKEALDINNASQILAEASLLRRLDHPYVVKFYGTSLLEKDGVTKVIMVLEKCKENLKNRIFNNRAFVPAETKDIANIKTVKRWAREISEALVFIHKEGVVHRDLTMENILLSEDNSVKIADVGESKEAKYITGSWAGTALYMAPEVFNSKRYSFQADIYNLGIILWEMWYGRQVFAGLKGLALKEIMKKIADDGYRPEVEISNCRKPPLPWKNLMTQCWSQAPHERPSAKKCYMEIKKSSEAVIRL